MEGAYYVHCEPEEEPSLLKDELFTALSCGFPAGRLALLEFGAHLQNYRSFAFCFLKRKHF